MILILNKTNIMNQTKRQQRLNIPDGKIGILFCFMTSDLYLMIIGGAVVKVDDQKPLAFGILHFVTCFLLTLSFVPIQHKNKPLIFKYEMIEKSYKQEPKRRYSV